MNLHRLLAERAAAGRPVRVGLIGAGKFGSMFLSQVPTTPGLEVAAIADLSVDRARASCREVGWTAMSASTASISSRTAPRLLAQRDDIEVLVESTGNPAAGIAHIEARD